mmetsp:Transcript_11416/g.29113  ORF Transcript_11416/g.29113 Transcript_11416/m.29113 type:complete len:241 (+) Transcript_11416:1213-1935(+)
MDRGNVRDEDLLRRLENVWTVREIPILRRRSDNMNHHSKAVGYGAECELVAPSRTLAHRRHKAVELIGRGKKNRIVFAVSLHVVARSSADTHVPLLVAVELGGHASKLAVAIVQRLFRPQHVRVQPFIQQLKASKNLVFAGLGSVVLRVPHLGAVRRNLRFGSLPPPVHLGRNACYPNHKDVRFDGRLQPLCDVILSGPVHFDGAWPLSALAWCSTRVKRSRRSAPHGHGGLNYRLGRHP